MALRGPFKVAPPPAAAPPHKDLWSLPRGQARRQNRRGGVSGPKGEPSAQGSHRYPAAPPTRGPLPGEGLSGAQSLPAANLQGGEKGRRDTGQDGGPRAVSRAHRCLCAPESSSGGFRFRPTLRAPMTTRGGVSAPGGAPFLPSSQDPRRPGPGGRRGAQGRRRAALRPFPAAQAGGARADDAYRWTRGPAGGRAAWQSIALSRPGLQGQQIGARCPPAAVSPELLQVIVPLSGLSSSITSISSPHVLLTEGSGTSP